MNLKIGYLPFANDAELKLMADNVVQAHNSQHTLDRFAPALIPSGAKSLAGVYHFQQVYIFAHGSEGSGDIYDSDGDKLSVTDLAKQLRTERLTVGIRKVKLWVCQGGVDGANSTAKRFKDAMVLAGFTNVSVYGYTKFLTDGLLGSHKSGVDATFNPDGSVKSMFNESAAKSIREKF